MALDLSSFSPALKILYSGKKVENLTYKNRPTYAMVAKNKDFYGESYKFALIHGNNQRRSALFATAQANTSTSKVKAFNLTRAKDYAFATVSNEVMEASENDKGAFLKALTTEIDGAFSSMADSDAMSIFGDGGGTIAQIAAAQNLALTVMTLRNSDDVHKFEIGQALQFASAKTGGTLRVGSLTVTAVDRDAGTVTLSAALNTIAAITASDYVLMAGDYDAKLKGFAAWLPETAPTAGDNFFGVDRSVDPVRLAGIRFDGSALPIEEALIKCSARMYKEGARPDNVVLPVDKYSDLEISLGTKVQYIQQAAYGNANINFQGIKLSTKQGVLNVFCDPWLTDPVGYMLTMSTWELVSLKDPIRFLMQDGLKMLRVNDADEAEARIGGYKQLGCHAPGWNARIAF